MIIMPNGSGLRHRVVGTALHSAVTAGAVRGERSLSTVPCPLPAHLARCLQGVLAPVFASVALFGTYLLIRAGVDIKAALDWCACSTQLLCLQALAVLHPPVHTCPHLPRLPARLATDMCQSVVQLLFLQPSICSAALAVQVLLSAGQRGGGWWPGSARSQPGERMHSLHYMRAALGCLLCRLSACLLTKPSCLPAASSTCSLHPRLSTPDMLPCRDHRTSLVAGPQAQPAQLGAGAAAVAAGG